MTKLILVLFTHLKRKLNCLLFHNGSKLFIIFVACVLILVISSLFGKDSAVHLSFFIVTVISLLIFDSKKESIYIILSTIISTLSWIYLENSNFHFLGIQAIEMTTSSQRVLYNLSHILINIFAILFFLKKNEKSERALVHANTELKRLYDEAKERNLMLEKASQQKAFSTLSQSISHLIQSPMAMILTVIEMIADNVNNPAKIGKYCEICKDHFIRLTKVTKSMLKYGIAGTTHSITFQNLNIAIETAIELAKPECERRDIEITSSLIKLQPIPFDENVLPQILLDILLNAIEAINDHGKIEISTQYHPFQNTQRQTQNGVKIEIKDNGCGIPKEKYSSIFDPFFSTKHGHSGLGLNISLKIIDAHGGNIIIEKNKEEQGTIVNIFLPQNPPKRVQKIQHQLRFQKLKESGLVADSLPSTNKL